MTTRLLEETAVRYFLEVVRTGSVKGAAHALNVAPSAVSRQVARLESGIGTLLFDRHARGMVPNAAGELLAAHAKRSQQDSERVLGDIAALRGLRRGFVRVVSAQGFAFDLIPTLIAQFQSKYEGIGFHLEACAQSTIPHRIRDGDADVGVTLSGLPEHGIKVELRHPSPIFAVMSCDHPLAQHKYLSLAQVVNYPLAVPVGPSSIRQLLDSSCSRQRLHYTTALTSNQADALVNYAAVARNSIAFYGELSVRARLREKLLVAVPMRDREMNERYLQVETLEGRMLPDAGRRFVEFLVQAIRQPMAGHT